MVCKKNRLRTCQPPDKFVCRFEQKNQIVIVCKYKTDFQKDEKSNCCQIIWYVLVHHLLHGLYCRPHMLTNVRAAGDFCLFCCEENVNSGILSNDVKSVCHLYFLNKYLKGHILSANTFIAMMIFLKL